MKLKIHTMAYFILIVVMFLLPFYSFQEYSIAKNTTSQLGAQNTPNSWIMNSTFVLMGLCSIYFGWLHYRNYWFHRIVLVCFGGSLILTAFFSHAPIDISLQFNEWEDQMHSVFAFITGFSFTILAISTAIIKTVKIEKVIPITVGILATILSILMFSIDEFMGIWQRLLFIISFGWTIYEFK
jgi:hypothetical membrane protein